MHKEHIKLFVSNCQLLTSLHIYKVCRYVYHLETIKLATCGCMAAGQSP